MSTSDVMIYPENETYYEDEVDEVDEADDADEVDDSMDDSVGAPTFEVPPRKIVAIEHPCVILNLDKGLATFGPDIDFQKLLTDTGEPSSVPLWFRPDNPTSKPIVSHHTATNNILLKITVPKRTGRKRKRGDNGPFTSDVDVADSTSTTPGTEQISSQSRRDLPKSILRKMQDNPEDYQVEAVGNIPTTHRYRGLADFQFVTTKPSFLTNIAENMLPMKVSKLRRIKFTPGVATGPGQEIIPPPHFTDRVIGFNYNYEQNPNTKIEGDEVGKQQLINIQGRKKHSYGHFINNNQYPVPEKPRREPAMHVPEALMNQLHKLMDERPIWTRRAILNRITGNYSDSVLRIALQLIGYQFRGGPWRDAFIKYGVDPRPDPSFRIYQTLAFKLERNIVGTKKIPWEVVRKGQTKKHVRENRSSHLWNGQNYSTDGKFWQVCDITDPFVRGIIDRAPLRETCDLKDSGWYHKGTWSKVKMVMKVKMVAIKRGRMGSDDDRPQKPGFLYNSFLEDRIRPFPDITDKPLGLTLEPFLRPMEELDSRLYKRRPPTIQNKQKVGSGTADGVSTPGGEDLEPGDMVGDGEGEGGDNDDETPMENSWDVEDLDGDDDADGDPEEEYEYYDNGDGEEDGGEEYGEDVE